MLLQCKFSLNLIQFHCCCCHCCFYFFFNLSDCSFLYNLSHLLGNVFSAFSFFNKKKYLSFHLNILSFRYFSILLVKQGWLGTIHKWRHANRGEGGKWFCDTLSEGVSKIPILAWQRGRGVNLGSKLCDVIYECPLKAHFTWNSFECCSLL